MVVGGCWWLLVVVGGCWWLLVVVGGCWWLLVGGVGGVGGGWVWVWVGLGWLFVVVCCLNFNLLDIHTRETSFGYR